MYKFYMYNKFMLNYKLKILLLSTLNLFSFNNNL